MKITLLDALASPVISEVKLYKAPELLADPVIKRSKSGQVTITCQSPDPVIYYTTDGSEPTAASRKYEEHSFLFPGSGTIKAKAYINNGKQSGATVTQTMDIASDGWNAVTPGAEKAVDGDPLQSSATRK